MSGFVRVGDGSDGSDGSPVGAWEFERSCMLAMEEGGFRQLAGSFVNEKPSVSRMAERKRKRGVA